MNRAWKLDGEEHPYCCSSWFLKDCSLTAMFWYSTQTSPLTERRLQRNLTAAFHKLKAAYKKEGEVLFTQADSDRASGNGFILKEVGFRLDVSMKLYSDGGERLSREGACCLISGSVQGLAGWGPQQPGLVNCIPVPGRRVGPRSSLRCLPAKPIY